MKRKTEEQIEKGNYMPLVRRRKHFVGLESSGDLVTSQELNMLARYTTS